MARIVLATIGSLGDLHPFLALGHELKSRGHDVVLATHGIYREATMRAGLAFHAVRPDAGDWGDEAEARRRAIDERSGSEYVVRALVLPFVRQSYADLMIACEGADAIVSHMLLFSAALVAEKLDLPRAHVMLQPAAMLSAYDPMPPPGMMRPPPFSPAAWKVLWRLARISTRPWFRDLEAFRAELGLPKLNEHPFFDSHSRDLNLALFSPLLAAPQPDWPERTVQPGFPFDDHGSHGQSMPPALEAFLADGPAPVVFTLGSTGVWDPGSFYREAARAAEMLGVRAVLLTGIPGGADFPLPPGVMACEYAPHRELFARASVNVHHGGVGTTAEALRAGRPMVIVPFSHDQPDNARRCIELGVARAIRRSRARADRLAREVRAVLDDLAMAEEASRVGEQIRGEPGVQAAVDAIEALQD